MPRAGIVVLILVGLLSASGFSMPTALPGGVSLALASSGDASDGSNSGSLGYGFGASLDQPFQAVGSQALASVFFFNLSQQDAVGPGVPIGGEGCSFFVNILDDKGRLVRRPLVPCPLSSTSSQALPVGGFPLPAGTFRRFDVPLPLAYATSETGDPDGTLLPGGLYTLQAIQLFDGPLPGGSASGLGLPFPGSDPKAQVPFRIYQCTDQTGPMPIRQLVQGSLFGFQGGTQTFSSGDLVLRTPEAGLQFWSQHTASLVPPPPPPVVDLTREMVLVSIGGTRQGGGSIGFTKVEEQPCHLEVTVLEVFGGAISMFETTPYDLVAVPRSLKEVVFVHQGVFAPAAP